MNNSILDLDWGTNSRGMDTNPFPGDTGVGMATRLSGISKVQQVNKQPTLLKNTTNDFDIAQQQQPPSRQCKSTILLPFNSITMNDQSPPKRVTRARAAAKTTDTAPKTTKIATAASKAKATRTAPTSKRKTRADDIHEDEEQLDPETIIESEPKPTRGRARKVVKPEPEPEMEEEAPAPVKATRGRPKKVVVETPAPEPTRSTRGRAKKVDVPEEQSVAVIEDPPKRAPRARAAPKADPDGAFGEAPRHAHGVEDVGTLHLAG